VKRKAASRGAPQQRLTGAWGDQDERGGMATKRASVVVRDTENCAGTPRKKGGTDRAPKGKLDQSRRKKKKRAISKTTKRREKGARLGILLAGSTGRICRRGRPVPEKGRLSISERLSLEEMPSSGKY